MSKLVIEVVDASDLMPKDGQGSSNPFVQVHFEDQRQRTQTKLKDLNPCWNEKLIFSIKNSTDHHHHQTIEVLVYNDRDGGVVRNFLGRVRISGASVASSQSEASIQRYPLDKRGLFSHIKGDIALKIYYAIVQSSVIEDTLVQENNTSDKLDEQQKEVHSDGDENRKKKNASYPLRTFHSIGAPRPALQPNIEKISSAAAQTRHDYASAGPASSGVRQVMRHTSSSNPEFGLVETRPPVAARLGHRGGDKTTWTYDLVEQMQYLYVNVVKARDLPNMDISGSIDPYIEVKLGNYKGVTKYLDKNQNPVWNNTFAFSKDILQSSLVEVTVKDKDIGKDDFVGRVLFEVTEVPIRVPPDSPLAPQWYKLEDKNRVKMGKGEVMLSVWMGTQADESFPEAWHSDAHSVSHGNLANTRSKIYFSPKLFYLRIHIIEAQDLEKTGHVIDNTYVKIQLGNQVRVTRSNQTRTNNPMWNEELMFVASEPFDEYLIVSVEERLGPQNDNTLGRLIIGVRDIPHRHDASKPPDARWFNLHTASNAVENQEAEKKRGAKFSSKIHLRLSVDSGYHVLDEAIHFSSDLQPSSKHLRKGNIGVLELGILSARNLLPMKGRESRTTDSYCVAKYGNKWVRTRTLLNTLAPRWNEQYSWDVYDPCTVITIGVFDNSHINGSNKDDHPEKDQRIGKVRVRLSTLEADKIYTHIYPLLVLTPSGLKKHGELQLALRFTCTGWVNMLTLYGLPLLPKMHYVQPISIRHIEWLRHQAIQIVAARLGRAEPPLRREAVEYMLDVDYHMWSLRRSKANFNRIMSLLSGFAAIFKWFGEICYWKSPITTCLVHVLFIILVCYPELILPTSFLYLSVIGIWNYRFRPRHPPHMDSRLSQAELTHPDELDEEFDTFPTTRPSDIVRMRYDRLRSVAGRVQTVIGDIASQGERALSLLSWRDPRATAIFIIFSLIFAVFVYITPFHVVAVTYGVYMFRHPRFRSKLPSVPVNFFKRLPPKSDMLL